MLNDCFFSLHMLEWNIKITSLSCFNWCYGFLVTKREYVMSPPTHRMKMLFTQKTKKASPWKETLTLLTSCTLNLPKKSNPHHHQLHHRCVIFLPQMILVDYTISSILTNSSVSRNTINGKVKWFKCNEE